VDIRSTLAKSILTKTSGFIAEAGFTHSLSPARNCTFGCTYCYVPTMGVYGGLKPEDSSTGASSPRSNPTPWN
jgi:DNA repair photolyase